MKKAGSGDVEEREHTFLHPQPNLAAKIELSAEWISKPSFGMPARHSEINTFASRVEDERKKQQSQNSGSPTFVSILDK